jgi:hypothetical protein
MKAPANFWSVMMGLAGIALSAISLMIATSNRGDDRMARMEEKHADDVRQLDSRVSRIEGKIGQ